MAVYEIFEGNLPRLEKKIERIRKKVIKFGGNIKYVKEGVKYKEISSGKGLGKFIVVNVEGELKHADYEFVAAIDKREGGNVIKGIADRNVPLRYTQGPIFCEHCKSNRARKHAYIIRNIKTNEYMEVGKSCLAEFTHGLSAEFAAEYISLYDELIEGEAPCNYGEDIYIPLKEVLVIAYEVIQKEGYVSVNNVLDLIPTKELVSQFYAAIYRPWSFCTEDRKSIYKTMGEMGVTGESERGKKVADASIKWILSKKVDSTYISNLQILAKEGYIKPLDIGLASSLIFSYLKNVKEEIMRKKQMPKQESTYQGAIGVRLEVPIISSVCGGCWETEFGVLRYYIFKDANGNVYAWKTSKYISDVQLMRIKGIKGTVKEYKEYKGVKQTVLTRCSIEFSNDDSEDE